VLDPFPFGGGVTLSDSIRCPRPVPFVTLPALQEVHRIGAGIAKALSLTEELTAANQMEFVAKAMCLARDEIFRRRVQESIGKRREEVLRSEEAVEEWSKLFQLLRLQTLKEGK
jgi:predicted O-linked N-acetylglucosamine transferase (SPINDLY family)